MFWDYRYRLWCETDIPGWLLFPIKNLKTWWKTRKIKIGSIVETCRFHPEIVERFTYDWFGREGIETKSILDDSQYSCSLLHCGVFTLRNDEAEEYVLAWKQNGERGLMKHVGYDNAWIDEFIEKWR